MIKKSVGPVEEGTIDGIKVWITLGSEVTPALGTGVPTTALGWVVASTGDTEGG
jgi:hypothetical protein